MAKVALGMEPLTVEGGNTASLLAAMLQGMKTQSHDRRRVGGLEYAKNATLEPERVV
jgi:hypothetical protein